MKAIETGNVQQLITRIRTLKVYHESGIITDEEFAAGIVVASNEYQNIKNS